MSRLAETLLFLDGWGEDDVSKRPRLMLYDPPLDPTVGFGFGRPAYVVWREKYSEIHHSKRLRSGVLAEVWASSLRSEGHHAVRVVPAGEPAGWTQYAPARLDPPVARVVWREGTEEHMRLFWNMHDAEGEATRLWALGMEDVSVERLDDDDGLSGMAARV